MKHYRFGVLFMFLSVSLLFFGCLSSNNDDETTTTAQVRPIDLKEPPAGTTYKLTILHTNDIHGQVQPLINNDRGGLARHSWLNQTIRNQNTAAGRHTLILNGGDTRDGTTINDATQTVALWQILNTIGYDATVIGNHDHIMGIQSLYNNLRTSFGADVVDDGVNPVVYGQHMKVLYGNINPYRINNFPGTYTTMEAKIKDSFENAFIDPLDPSDPDPAMYPSTIDQTRFTPMYDATSRMFYQKLFFDMGDFVVGMFGATNTEVIYTFVPGEPLSLFGNPLPAGIMGEGGIFYSANPLSNNYTNQMIDYLADPDGDGNTSDGADVIICLSHTGVAGDMDIARYGRGPRTGRRVDIVVGAHSHNQLNRAVEVVHPLDGTKSWVVQAKASGMFLGRIDLDFVNGKPVVVNSGLIEVNGNIPEDPTVKSFVDNEITKVGGVNDWFVNQAPDVGIDPYGVMPTDIIGHSEVDFKTTVFAGENPLTNLISNAFLWQGQLNSIFNYPGTAWDPRTDPGYTDFALLIPFVLHGEGVLTDGPITVEAMLDTLHIHDISPNPSRPDTMNIIALTPVAPILVDLPDMGINTTLGSHVEAFLEVLYGIVDLMDALAATLPPNLAAQIAGYKGAIQEYLGTLQWSGISFVVDFSKPPLERIDPASILISGQPLDPNRVYYFSMNSTISKFLGAIGGIIGQLLQATFIEWDPVWSETNVPEWVALMNYIRFGVPGSNVTTDMVAITGSGLRAKSPDLTLQAWDIQFSPAVPIRGGTVTIREWILNTGMMAVNDADIDFTYDPTPGRIGDNPDGYTDVITSYSNRYIGRDHVRNVPPYTDHLGAALSNGFTWAIPMDIAPGQYEICPEIRNLVSPVPEFFTGNNSGAGLCATLTIQ